MKLINIRSYRLILRKKFFIGYFCVQWYSKKTKNSNVIKRIQTCINMSSKSVGYENDYVMKVCCPLATLHQIHASMFYIPTVEVKRAQGTKRLCTVSHASIWHVAPRRLADAMIAWRSSKSSSFKRALSWFLATVRTFQVPARGPRSRLAITLASVAHTGDTRPPCPPWH